MLQEGTIVKVVGPHNDNEQQNTANAWRPDMDKYIGMKCVVETTKIYGTFQLKKLNSGKPVTSELGVPWTFVEEWLQVVEE